MLTFPQEIVFIRQNEIFNYRLNTHFIIKLNILKIEL